MSSLASSPLTLSETVPVCVIAKEMPIATRPRGGSTEAYASMPEHSGRPASFKEGPTAVHERTRAIRQPAGRGAIPEIGQLDMRARAGEILNRWPGCRQSPTKANDETTVLTCRSIHRAAPRSRSRARQVPQGHVDGGGAAVGFGDAERDLLPGLQAG